MANINIKRYNGDAWEIHYPKTTIGQVINLSSQLANMQSELDGKSQRIILTGQLQTTSYRRSVIALCELTNTNPGANSYSVGTLTFHRTNGLNSAVKYDFVIEKRYNSEGFNLSQTVLTSSSFINGIKPCIFVKNGIKYGGIEVFFSNAELRQIEFHGTTNFGIFGLDYYVTNTSTPLDTEVNNSLVLDDPTNIRIFDSFKAGNQLVVLNNDSRLTDARTPTTHSHPKSQITNFDNEVLALSPAGARTPTTHSHPKSEITNFDNEVLALSPAGARTPTTHTHTKAQITDFAHTHNYLSSLDDRDIKPNNLSYNRVQTYFTSLEGLTGTTGSDYQDLFVLNTYNDSSGGKVNALALDKSEMKIRLYQAAQADTTWGTPKTLAFSEDTVNLTGNQTIAGTKTFTGDVTLDTTLGATIQDSKNLIFKYNRGTIGGGVTQKAMYVDSDGALRFNGAELSKVGHSHSKSDITNFDSEVLALSPAGARTPTTHSHPKSQITNFDSEVLALSPAGARTPTTHSHPKSEITNFDSEVLALSPPWKLIRDIQIVIPTTLTTNNVTVVSGNYYNKILAFEVRVATGTDSYETHVVFVRMGSNNGTAVSATYDRLYSWTTFDGQYFKTHSFKAYCTNATSTVITVGALRHLIGSFSGNTIEWTTPTVTTYLERIWLVN